MGSLFKTRVIKNSATRISAFAVNQSSYGVPIKIVFGTTVVSPVLIDYMDFTAIKHVETQKAGKGGKVKSQTITYTYTVAADMALAEGVCSGVGKVYADSKTTDLKALNLTFFNGFLGGYEVRANSISTTLNMYAKGEQFPWGYMVSKHPDHALIYGGICHVAGVLDLGESASLPNLNFEVFGLCQSKNPVMYVNRDYHYTVNMDDDYIKEWIPESDDTPAHWGYKLDITLPLKGYVKLNYITSNQWSNTSDFGQVISRLGLNYAIGVDGRGVTTIHIYQVFASTTQKYTWVNVNYEMLSQEDLGQPPNEKMQQFAYQKKIEISNFRSNRFVEEFVFDSLNGVGVWVTLDSRYYTVTQSKDQYGHKKDGVYTYTFNFDDRDDGYYRPDATYIRIYYYAIEGNITFTPTDANPSDIITYVLESDVFGSQFPMALLGDFSEYSEYCKKNKLLISPAYDSATACTDIINSIMECTNSEYVFSQGKVKLIPYWDELPASYAITDKDILNQEEDSVIIERTSDADIYNIIPLEHLSRANDYNTNMVYATNEGDIEINGVRQAGTYTHHEIMTPQLAQAVAQIILQKQLYNRNKYTIRVGQEFILLEPMDACTLEVEMAQMGLTTVRVVSIKENADDFSLDITFEDNYSGLTTAPDYPVQLAESATPVTDADAGNINYPVIFEVPYDLAKSTNHLDMCIYASGQNKYWGGCNVWVSEDGNSYIQIGTINNPATQGKLITDLPVGSSVDTVNTPLVQMLAGELTSTTQEGADSYETLCYVDGEFISYQTAELVDVGTYKLSYLRRGLFGSPITNHNTCPYLVRCDSTRLVYNFNEINIGKTYYIKFTSFNVFGGNEQMLSDVEPYLYTVYGMGMNYAPEPITNLVSYISEDKTYIEWSEVPDDRAIYYEIRKGDSWDNSIVIAKVTNTKYQITSSGTYWVASAYDGTSMTYYSASNSINVEYNIIGNIIGGYEESAENWVGTCTNTIIIP